VIRKIVSGGQSGADRAALDFALAHGFEVGGWVPKARLAEDGPIPRRYFGLRETASADPSVRTALNVRDSDATLIVSHGPPTGGSLFTLREATRIGKPVLHLDLDAVPLEEAARVLREWLSSRRPSVLNVAGPRASGDPRIAEATEAVLRGALLGP